MNSHNENKLRVSVFGAGYVGLVTAACLAERGHHVTAVDKHQDVIAMLSDGVIHIYEPGLQELISSNLDAGRLRFTDDAAEALTGADIVFICVGTPTKRDGSPDLSQVEEVARTIAVTCTHRVLVVEKSTVPVKTASWIKRTFNLFSSEPDLYEIASNPEFLREGSALSDFMHPDRIVIGVESEWAEQKLRQLYADIEATVLVTDVKTAEIIKHASNSFLAMKISFINMIADLCDKTGADISLVATGMGLDKRIGESFLNAGLGYGGSCFPKDVNAFINIAERHGVDFSLLSETARINDHRIDVILEKIYNALWVAKDKTIAILGLAFKPDTDDIRHAPSISLIERLLGEEARLHLYDPKAATRVAALYPESPSVKYFETPYQALTGAHLVVVVTEWQEIVTLDLDRSRKLMATPVMVDGRNVFDPTTVRLAGFQYYGMGTSDEPE